MKTRHLLIPYFLFLISYSCPAQPKYEFRGVWIATVNNIDWPKSGQWDPESQKADFIRILDGHQKNGMNAMIVQSLAFMLFRILQIFVP